MDGAKALWQKSWCNSRGVWCAKGASYLQKFEPDYMLEHMRNLLEIVKEE